MANDYPFACPGDPRSGAADLRLPAAGEMPVLAWYGVQPDFATAEHFRTLAEAGFNRNFTGSSLTYGRYPTADEQARALDLAAEAGVKVHVLFEGMLDDPAAAARRFKDHPAVGAWFITDEPGASDFATLAARVREIRAIDDNPDHFCYVNLHPNYADPELHLQAPSYAAYVERFTDEVPVRVLSFDHYPVTHDGLRLGWYENLEIVAGAARRRGIPFWAFALAIAHGPYPPATLEHLRLQVFSNLAYGAQGIQYFTYWGRTHEGWGIAPTTADGRPTRVYDLVRQVNRDIHGLSRVFLGSRVLAVGHAGAIPAGARAFEPIAPITRVATHGGGAVVSILARGQRRFLAVVNRDLEQAMSLEVDWRPGAAMARVWKDGTLVPVGESQHRTAIEPGDIDILSWCER